jgi:hypothetical protein
VNDATTFKDFDDLVTWATWHVVSGITKGQPLRTLIFDVLEVARRTTFAGSKL